VCAQSRQAGKDEPNFTDADYRDQADFRASLRRFLHFSEEEARRQDLTPQQHMMLLAARGHAHYPNVSIRDVAEALQVRHHSASLLVDRCVRRGRLSRRRDPTNRRRALLTLTNEGQQVLDTITRANRGQLQALKGQIAHERMWEAIVTYEDRGDASPR
jgi:DNA-binding MarR family transcriptional regulator